MGPRRMAVPFALALLALAGAQAQTQARAQARPPAQADQAASTRRQAEQTERAERDAAVADETGKQHPDATGANPRPLPPAYGPVLDPRYRQQTPPATDVPGRKDPAEVHDETDTLAPQGRQPERAGQQKGAQDRPPARQRQQARRHPAWQGPGPLAPRPLRPDDPAPSAGVPVPAPVPGPQPLTPGTSVVGCPGGVCRDAAGTTFNQGANGTGVSSGGRLCTRSGTTVQCL